MIPQSKQKKNEYMTTENTQKQEKSLTIVQKMKKLTKTHKIAKYSTRTQRFQA